MPFKIVFVGFAKLYSLLKLLCVRFLWWSLGFYITIDSQVVHWPRFSGFTFARLATEFLFDLAWAILGVMDRLDSCQELSFFSCSLVFQNRWFRPLGLVKMLKAPLWEFKVIMITCSLERNKNEMHSGAREIMGLGALRPETKREFHTHISSH